MTSLEYEQMLKEEPDLELPPLGMLDFKWRMYELPKVSRKEFLSLRAAYLMRRMQLSYEFDDSDAFPPQDIPF